MGKKRGSGCVCFATSHSYRSSEVPAARHRARNIAHALRHPHASTHTPSPFDQLCCVSEGKPSLNVHVRSEGEGDRLRKLAQRPLKINREERKIGRPLGNLNGGGHQKQRTSLPPVEVYSPLETTTR